jgi:polysaccharide deacetylase 2 family uncharacterized protein YibQ
LGSLLGLQGFSKAFAFEKKSDCVPEPTVSLIIDDIGFSTVRAERLLDLETPITFSILPRLRMSYDLALEIHDRGHEIMLHQPMEPFNPQIDPGPGALYVGYEANRIADILERNIVGLPYVIGVNNHMGSRFTASQKEVKDFIVFIKETGLFFIDSLTTNRSKAYKTAKQLNVDTARRNIFLDNCLEESAILYQLTRLRTIAQKYGCAIGIGHPFPETARALRHFIKGDGFAGCSLVPVSKLICFV